MPGRKREPDRLRRFDEVDAHGHVGNAPDVERGLAGLLAQALEHAGKLRRDAVRDPRGVGEREHPRGQLIDALARFGNEPRFAEQRQVAIGARQRHAGAAREPVDARRRELRAELQ